MSGWIVAAFLLGWIFGTWMSWRKILKERRQAERTRAMMVKQFSRSLFRTLQDQGVITVDGEKKLRFDQKAFDRLLGNKPTEH